MVPEVRESSGRFVASALLAACLYALSTPFSKVLLANVPSNMMAALLYLGAGLGMAMLVVVRSRVEARAGSGVAGEAPLGRADAPYVVAMVALDVAAPLLLMAGLAHATPENVTLLNNFEIVATSVIAFAFFRERVAPRTWAGIVVITCACALLMLEGGEALSFSSGSLMVLGACVCWGVENNCTSRLSEKDPMQIVTVKGLGSGAGALAVALAAGDALPGPVDVAAALLLGFVAYGLSILFYVYAQRGIGAARTSAYYAVNPFVGALLSLALFRTVPAPTFLAALALMVLGTWLVTPRGEGDGAAGAAGATDGDGAGGATNGDGAPDAADGDGAAGSPGAADD